MTPSTQHPNDDHSNVTPFRRPARRRGEITVEHIETTPMTPQQYRRAVTALAQLINEWKYRDENHPGTEQKAA
ncbi:hypothetical protein [Nocardia wallacei]|uniref:hypothetical protein n=1 Tax=Nocardia wallacei TaxID=480035 RepID=UPI002453FB85|nr:hypothetical protein [Nocardia wallacei]